MHIRTDGRRRPIGHGGRPGIGRVGRPGIRRPLIAAILLLLALSVAACRTGGPASPSASSGLVPVHGDVLGRPCAGGPESVGSPCPGIPVAHVQVVFLPPSGAAAATESGEDGSFTIRLAPGHYLVTVTGRRYYAGTGSVTLDVPGSALATAPPLTLVIDTGLR